MTREEIIRRIEIEETRRASAYRNIEGLTVQAGKSQDEISRLYALLETMSAEEPTDAV